MHAATTHSDGANLTLYIYIHTAHPVQTRDPDNRESQCGQGEVLGPSADGQINPQDTVSGTPHMTAAAVLVRVGGGRVSPVRR